MAMRMMKLAAAAALMAGVTGSALAADLDRIIYSPQIDRTVPVEIGNGWYLRGDIGYAVESEGQIDSVTFGGLVFDGDAVDTDFSSELSGGLGVGYQFTDFLRADFTAEYSEGEGSVSSGPIFDGEADFDAITLMANGYLDLGTFVGITPYVGAGIGATRVDWSPVAFDTPPAEADGSADWRLTYALMAGASYDLTKAIKLDFGYRFIDVAGGEIYNDPFLGSGEDDGYSKHEIRAGFRYMLW